jgi:hypothetical protein
MARPSRQEIIAKLTKLEIQFNPEAPYNELTALIPDESAPQKGPIDTSKPDISNEDLLNFTTPPCGLATMKDFEKRLRVLERKAGIR